MFFSTILFKVFTGGRFIWAQHPFFLTHGLMHTTMIVRNFTRERIPSEVKDDPCVFLDFFVFWRLCEMYLPDVQYFFAINNGVPSKCSVFFIQYYYQDYKQVAFSSSNFSYRFSPFRTRRLIHTTVIILNFTWERVPTDEKDASCIFLQTFGFWWVHETVNHD